MITSQTTMGAELEFARLSSDATTSLSQWLKFTTHNDGSVRDRTYVAGTVPIYPQEGKDGKPILSVGMKELPPYGLEIVTEPYTYADLRPIAQKLSYMWGHIPQNPRTSIHIHVDADGETWREIQSLLKWTRALEAVIYRVACAGQEHRGCKSYQGDFNDHRYARPLSAPIGIEWTDGTVSPLIRWNDIVNATSASAMLAAWGRLDLYWGSAFDHYMPHRLHMINLASILRQGTVEWRVFDGLYAHFDLLVDFVYAIHALSGKLQEPDFDFPLGSSPPIDAAWVSKLLDVDIAPLWGINWQSGCVRKSPQSHYPNKPVLRTYESVPVRPVVTGRKMDMGEDVFPLFIRS